jgi:succinate-semialdehyde dehydrogenase/glutarate-semialdehyde dehydrogenase
LEKSYTERVDHIYDCAQELRKKKEVLARTVTKEMGKVIKEARSELEKCECLVAEGCYYY